MRILLIIIIISFFVQKLYAQNDQSRSRSGKIFRLNIFHSANSNGRSTHKNLNLFRSLKACYINLDYQTSLIKAKKEDCYPFINYDPKVYAGFERRAVLNLSKKLITGPYIALQARYIYPIGEVKAWQTVGPIWGFQSHFGTKLTWNVGLGLCMAAYNWNALFGSIGEISINYNIY